MSTASGVPEANAPARRSDVQIVRYEKYIDNELRKTRRQVRMVDLTWGAMALLTGALAYLFAAALVDQWLVSGGMGYVSRTVALAIFLAGAIGWTAWAVGPLLFRKINPVYAARAIELSRPSLKNGLVNFLMLRSHPESISPAVFAQIEKQAATGLSQAPLENTVDRSHLLKLAYALLAIVSVLAIYKVASPKDPIRSVRRVLAPWADIAPATRVRINDVDPREARAFNGKFVKVSAEITGLSSHEEALIFYSTADGQVVNQSAPMTLPPGEFRYVAELPPSQGGLQQDMEYWIEAGDAKTPHYPIHVLTTPSIVVDKIDYRLPRYTEIEWYSTDRQGDISALEGTEVVIHATANEDIREAYIDFDCNGSRDTAMEVKDRQATVKFTLALKNKGEEGEHTSYQLRFVNTDGEENPQPLRYKIEVTPDRPPVITFSEPIAKEDEEQAIQPNESLTLVVQASDPDFKLKDVTIFAERNGLPLLKNSLLPTADAQLKNGTFLLGDSKLGLKAGDTIEYWAEAIDNKTPSPNSAKTSKRKLRVAALDPKRPPQRKDDGAGNQNQPNPDRNQERKPNDDDKRNGEPQKGPNQPGQRDPRPQQERGTEKPDEPKTNPRNEEEDPLARRETVDDPENPDRGAPPKDPEKGPKGAQRPKTERDPKDNQKADDPKAGPDQPQPDPKEAKPEEKKRADGTADPGNVIQKTLDRLKEKQQKQNPQPDKQPPPQNPQKDPPKDPQQDPSQPQPNPTEQEKPTPDKKQPKPNQQNKDEQQKDEQEKKEQGGGESQGNEGGKGDGKSKGGPGGQSGNPSNDSKEQGSEPGKADPNKQTGGDNSAPDNKSTGADAKGKNESGGGGNNAQKNEKGNSKAGKDEVGKGNEKSVGGKNAGDKNQTGAAGKDPKPDSSKPNALDKSNDPKGKPGDQNPSKEQTGDKPGGTEGEKAADDPKADPSKKPGDKNADDKGAEKKGPDAKGAEGKGPDEKGPDAKGASEKPNDDLKGADQKGAGGNAKEDKTGGKDGEAGKDGTAGQKGTTGKPGDPKEKTPKNESGAGEGKATGKPGEKTDDQKDEGEASDGGTEQKDGKRSNKVPKDLDDAKIGPKPEDASPDDPIVGKGKPSADKPDNKAKPDAKAGTEGEKSPDAQTPSKKPDDASGQKTGPQQGSKSDQKGTGQQPSKEQKQPGADKSQQNKDPSASDSKQQSGAAQGAKSDGQEGSPKTDQAVRPNDKTSDDQKEQKDGNSGDPQSPSKGQKDSNTKGQKGDDSGDGGKGGGKASNSAGTGSRGKNTEVDQGSGAGQQSGAGETVDRKGNKKPGEGEQGGQPSEQAGKGKTSRPGEKQEAGTTTRQTEELTGGGPGTGEAGKGFSEGNPTGGGSGNPGTTKAGDIAPPPPKQEGRTEDEANLEYAKKNTDLALEYLKDQLAKGQIDQELADELQWTREDMDRFVKQWERFKQMEKSADPAERRQFDERVEALGLRPQGTAIKGGRIREQSSQSLHQTKRSEPPPEYRQQYRVFSSGGAKSRQPAGK